MMNTYLFIAFSFSVLLLGSSFAKADDDWVEFKKELLSCPETSSGEPMSSTRRKDGVLRESFYNDASRGIQIRYQSGDRYESVRCTEVKREQRFRSVSQNGTPLSTSVVAPTPVSLSNTQGSGVAAPRLSAAPAVSRETADEEEADSGGPVVRETDPCDMGDGCK